MTPLEYFYIVAMVIIIVILSIAIVNLTIDIFKLFKNGTCNKKDEKRIL